MEILKARILEESQIVCSTLSFAGSTVFSAALATFDCVIIDEAAQAVEPSTLIPLVNGCRQVRGLRQRCCSFRCVQSLPHLAICGGWKGEHFESAAVWASACNPLCCGFCGLPLLSYHGHTVAGKASTSKVQLFGLQAATQGGGGWIIWQHLHQEVGVHGKLGHRMRC